MTIANETPHAAAGLRPELRQEYGLFIDGQWARSASGRTAVSYDPSTEQPLASVAVADEADADRAARAGAAAWRGWWESGWQHRAAVLREMARRLADRADEFARIDAIDGGIPVAGMRKDVANSVNYLLYYAGVASELKGETIESGAGSINLTLREPYGVVGRIVPFNHPLQFAVQGIAGPLAAGNAIVLKPSDHTPISALHFAELVADLVPAGLINILPGDGRTGAAIVGHPLIPRIAFTGSIASGKAVLRAAAEHIKPVSLELGGKNPMIIHPDVNIDAVADAAVVAMNLRRGQGQSCGSPSRIFAHAAIHDDFVAAVEDRLARFRTGDPLDEATDMGPLAFRAHYDRVVGYVESAHGQGARLVTGGARPDGLDEGLYLAPTVFDGVTPDMTIANDEIFGPVISVLRWADQADVLRVANSLPVGLTANIWTNDLSAALRLAKEVDAGYVWVNGQGQRPLGAPFGGHKLSGIGSENDLAELLSYTKVKNINLSTLA
ncbi:MAG TPA: aldehyde dehydrogenase family protein [Trebonia sp.]|nr:aldehyde dehydrogenase family protein [Trebonia sp.]